GSCCAQVNRPPSRTCARSAATISRHTKCRRTWNSERTCRRRWSERSSAVPSSSRVAIDLSDRRRERLALFDDEVGHDAGGRRAGILCAVDGAGGNQKRLTGGRGERRLSFLLNHDRAFEHVTDFFTRVCVGRGGGARL